MGQETELVSEITKLTGVVLVCWEHKHISSVSSRKKRTIRLYPVYPPSGTDSASTLCFGSTGYQLARPGRSGSSSHGYLPFSTAGKG